MAEFTEVVRQYERMCGGNNCDECPMRKTINSKVAVCADVALPTDHAEEVEKIIMDWAAAHPEPQYPTWAEWFTTKFSRSIDKICPKIFMDRTCYNYSCAECRNEPIPAEIAEKLGVLPKGVK